MKAPLSRIDPPSPPHALAINMNSGQVSTITGKKEKKKKKKNPFDTMSILSRQLLRL